MIIDADFPTLLETISQTDVVVADFYSETCAPCQRMFKILPRLDEELDGKATICKVDADKHSDVKTMYSLRGVPTFIFFKDGQEKYRQTGIMTLENIKTKVMELQ